MDPQSREAKPTEEAKEVTKAIFPMIPGSGRDELNLAEFPFANLQYQRGSEAKTLYFSDTITGKDGQSVDRSWTVTGSDAYGLPVAGDVDIVIALLSLTQEQGMKSREVLFSRYDLLRLMGWDNRGRNYARVKDGLDRLTGTTIKAERAFYDKQKQAYLTRSFHIIDDYDLWDRAGGVGDAAGQGALPLKSVVTWNRHIFKSLTDGYVKRLDTARYFRLSTPIAKQLYRYLDKKFYRAAAYRIDLFKLCHEHLGISRACKHVSKLKERLEPALQELVRDGYLRAYEYAASRSARNGVVLQFSKAPNAEGIADTATPAAYFYQQLHQRAECHRPLSGRERGLADDFVRRHGLDTFREFVDFVMREKPTQWPDLATLTGAFQAFEDSFLGRLQERERRQEEAQRERRKRDLEAGFRETYAAYLSPLRERMKREHADLFAEVERQAQEIPLPSRKFQEGDGPLAKAARELAERERESNFGRLFAEAFKDRGVLDFEAWRASQAESSPAPDPSQT